MTCHALMRPDKVVEAQGQATPFSAKDTLQGKT